MTAAIRNKLALVALVSATCLVDHGHSFAPNHNHNKATFAPPRSSPLVKKTKTPTTTAHRALPVDAAADMAHHAAAASGVGWDQIVQSASHFLSQDEAAAAAAAAPAVAGEATGWWGAYVNFFKTTLLAVHGAVDGPLKSMGIEQSWGVSIGLFTLCARGLLVPLSIKQSQGAEYTKALKPYVSEIKSKYKNNQDAQNRAIAKLYEDAQQNPLAGCFLSLAQIPVFLGLYRGVRYLALEGMLDEKFLWIPSLAGPVGPPDFRGLDWLTQGWTDVNGTPTPPLGWETTLAFMIMPVVLVLLQSATMQILQPPIDEDATDEEREQMESTQTVLKFLPLMIGFFSLQVPAGLTIYWFASNIFTVTQSLSVRAYFAANPPKIELPEYWDKTLDGDMDFESMTPEERRQAAEAGLRVGPTMMDLVAESKFHTYVERRSFREETPAWTRVQEHGASPIPEELEVWAKGDSAVAKAPVEKEPVPLE